ncbi:50S ribosomal protein L35ae [Candidatus Pacearchaeota archaeon]|nr:50S ribosomal protein L35ae [Candidatus Pacearchaeota archaeon]
MVKGKVIQFRQGRHTIKQRHYLIEIENVSDREKAKTFSGKEVIWTSPTGKEIKGKIADAHGNKGVVRAIFEKGLPGQAITTEVVVK